jgi:membrane complex biogenesis BtpA family protein
MKDLKSLFGVEKPLIAMCHLAALPGRPRHDVAAGMAGIVEALRRDVGALQPAGVDGLLFCNENDIPYQLSVGAEVASAMTAAIVAVKPELGVPFGVDILWDARASLAVARAVGAAFVREVFTGVFESDMGLFEPRLGDLAGYRHLIGADAVALFANITPEFSRSISDRPVADRARGAAYMGLDALLISGVQAGVSAGLADLRAAKRAAPELPVIANTGVSHENVRQILEIADGAIVGTSLKRDGSTWNPVDGERARRMVELVRATRAPAAA